MIFDSWTSLARIVVVGSAAYAGLILILRVFGKRMLSKMNAFDLVVTVALGSTLSTVITSKEISLAEGITALAVLVGLQYVLAWAAARSSRVEHLVKSEPTLLFFRGEFLTDALRNENVSAAGIRAHVRAQGIANLADVEAVVFESDGSMNAIPRGNATPSALAGVQNYPPPEKGVGRVAQAAS